MEILSLIIIVSFIILPVKVTATQLDARHSSIFMCAIALILAAIIQQSVSLFIPQLATEHAAFNGIVAIFLSAVAYMIVLGINYFEGIIVALIQTVLTFIMIFLVGLSGLSVSFFHSYYTTNTFNFLPI